MPSFLLHILSPSALFQHLLQPLLYLDLPQLKSEVFFVLFFRLRGLGLAFDRALGLGGEVDGFGFDAGLLLDRAGLSLGFCGGDGLGFDQAFSSISSGSSVRSIAVLCGTDLRYLVETGVGGCLGTAA